MKKAAKEFQTESVAGLEKDANLLRTDIAKATIERKVKPEKDSNMLFKKKKRLAVMLTLITQKKLGITS